MQLLKNSKQVLYPGKYKITETHVNILENSCIYFTKSSKLLEVIVLVVRDRTSIGCLLNDSPKQKKTFWA